jgi:hypothetical protein
MTAAAVNVQLRALDKFVEAQGVSEWHDAM